MERRTNCPMCEHRGLTPDVSGHLYINDEKGVFYCFRCGHAGRVNEASPRVPFEMRSRQAPAPAIARENEMRRLGIRPLPTEPQTRVQAHMLEYLRKRHVNAGMVRAWQIHYAVAGTYDGRVVFPCYGNSGLEFFVARAIDAREPKTLHPPKGDIWPGKGGVVWGIDRISESGLVVLCEGVFDAAVAPGGVAILGRTISDLQIQKIGIRASKVAVMMDGDAYDAAVFIRKAFFERFPRMDVTIVRVPEDKDPADIGPVGVWQLLNEKGVLTNGERV